MRGQQCDARASGLVGTEHTLPKCAASHGTASHGTQLCCTRCPPRSVFSALLEICDVFEVWSLPDLVSQTLS